MASFRWVEETRFGRDFATCNVLSISNVSKNLKMSRRYVRSPIFIQIVNVIDLHFQGQRFELNTFQVHSVVLEPSGV